MRSKKKPWAAHESSHVIRSKMAAWEYWEGGEGESFLFEKATNVYDKQFDFIINDNYFINNSAVWGFMFRDCIPSLGEV